MSVKMEVWGDFACFSRIELKIERVSYDHRKRLLSSGIKVAY